MKLNLDLRELVHAGIIDKATSDSILAYHQKQKEEAPNRLLVVFGILGAILVGLGIILIIAHNWENLNRSSKTIIAFLPLIASQALSFYSILRERSKTWLEASGSFLFLSIGACIALISQIYHLDGAMEDFLLSWLLLALPAAYLLRSSMVSLLYLCGITAYAYAAIDHDGLVFHAFGYWVLLGLWFPKWIYDIRRQGNSNFGNFTHWILSISLVLCAGTIAERHEELLLPAYFTLFALFYLFAQSPFAEKWNIKTSAFRVLGHLGSIIVLLILSFKDIWESILRENFLPSNAPISPELILSICLSLLAFILLLSQMKNKAVWKLSPLSYTFVVVWIIFILGNYSALAPIFINLLLLSLGIFTVLEGSRENRLVQLNYGLLIITALIISRFFDTDLSFVMRGILFLLVGTGFFIANYSLIRKKKKHEA